MNAMKKDLKLVLSQTAIQYIYKFGYPVANYQFIGYIFPVNKKMNGALDLNGKWGLYSCVLNKKGNPQSLTKRNVFKQISKWIKEGFLVRVKDSPFPEFEYYNNIKIDVDKIHYIDKKLFDEV